MAIIYRIYSNSGLGDPINYSSPISEVSTLTFTTDTLVAPGDYLFGVRTVDTSTNLEEANTNVRVRLILDAAGNNITQQPSSPFAIHVRLTALGARISWCHRTILPSAPPTGFHVYLGVDPVINYTAPIAVAEYLSGSLLQSVEITGLATGSKYAVSVRAFNGISEERNTQVAAFEYLRPRLSGVDELVGTTCLGW